MIKLTLAAVAVVLTLAPEALSKDTPAAGSLAAACTREAQAGHAMAWRLEPSLRAMIEDHRARMSSICTQLSAGTGSKSEFLADCLSEAAKGPRHIQRGRDMDRDHVARQKELCRKLAS